MIASAAAREKVAETRGRCADALDLMLTMPMLCFMAELGVAAQCRYVERWPFYGGVAVYIGFAIAYQREVLSSKNENGSDAKGNNANGVNIPIKSA